MICRSLFTWLSYRSSPKDGRPDYYYHESRQQCDIPPQRGVSPREATDTCLSRIQGSMITAVTNLQATMPHPALQGREPSGSNRHYPKQEPGLGNFAIANPRNHAASPQAGGRSRETIDICGDDGCSISPAIFEWSKMAQ